MDGKEGDDLDEDIPEDTTEIEEVCSVFFSLNMLVIMVERILNIIHIFNALVGHYRKL